MPNKIRKDVVFHNKLVRDGIIDHIKTTGDQVYHCILKRRDFRLELRRKMVEEAQKVADARTKQELITELADVLEVLKATAREENIDFSLIEKVRRERKLVIGGFEERIFLVATIPPKKKRRAKKKTKKQ